MSYITVTEIKALIDPTELDQLIVDSKYDKGGNDDFISECITEADTIIDYNVGSVYVAPFVTIPAIVKTFARHITFYYMYLRRIDGEMPDTIEKNHDWALKELTLIRKNQANIPDASMKAGAGFQVSTNKSSTAKKYTSAYKDTIL